MGISTEPEINRYFQMFSPLYFIQREVRGILENLKNLKTSASVLSFLDK